MLASAVTFAVAHYINLAHGTLDGVSIQVGAAFVLGLGLGTVRLATGSLGWCILIHWFADAAGGLGNDYGGPRLLFGYRHPPGLAIGDAHRL